MARKARTLAATWVKAVVKPGTYSDGGGLSLRVHPSGSKNWVVRTTIKGKQTNIGVGGYPEITLLKARNLAESKIKEIKAGKNPVAANREVKRETLRIASIPTFRRAAEDTFNLNKGKWRSERHTEQWLISLEKYAYPVVGDKRVDQITRSEVLEVLRPIWDTVTETANRVRQRMEAVFGYAIANEWRDSNPADKTVSKALPHSPRQKKHHPALPYADVPAAIRAAHESTADQVTKLAFEFMVLTAARAGEARLADWSEIDLDAATWTIPAHKMKGNRTHRVPLSDRAVTILQEAKAFDQGNGVVFPSSRNGKPLSDMCFTNLLRRLEIAAVPHGFRASFKDFALETFEAFGPLLSEAALAHKLGSTLESTYIRTDLLEQRRPVMQSWSDFLTPAPS
jgi:integrase